MSEISKYVLPLVLLAVGAVGYFALVAMREDPPREEPQSLAPVVEVEPVLANASHLTLEVDGVAVPFREITLSAEVGGRITYKSESCRAGRFVRKGEKLLVIDPRDYELALRRLQEELEQAQVTRAELDIEIANAGDLLANRQEDLKLQRNELEREQQLGAASTRSHLDQALRAVNTSENQVIELNNQIRLLQKRQQRLDSTVELAKSMRDQAALDLERTTIVAPVDGVVVADHIEQNSLAQLGAQLVTIEDTSAIEVKCSLEMDQLYWIWSQAGSFQSQDPYRLPPLPATVVYEAGGRQYQWKGELSRYDGVGIDERTRMVPCRVVVDNPQQVAGAGSSVSNASLSSSAPSQQPVVPALMRGMFVTVELEVEPNLRLLGVSERAIRPTGEVVVVTADSASPVNPADGLIAATARLVPVKVLNYDGDRATVLPLGDLLHAGDRVAVSPLPGVSLYEMRERGVEVRVAPRAAERGAIP